MKFGRRLEEDLQEVGWEEHYVRYRRLKKLIKILGVADEETFDEDYVGSGALERFMNGGEEWEAARSLRCFQCKRCRVFALMIRVDILSVKSFLRETLAVLKATFVGSVFDISYVEHIFALFIHTFPCSSLFTLCFSRSRRVVRGSSRP
mmetsp:Transcript_14085/g.23005  ORF Transcript_14085/g.23005 Transcript_14085/m.23005 type:complete len:149 (-) Transcript_14085:1006-1452(-)